VIGKSFIASMMVALVLSATLLSAQNPPAAPSSLEEGRKVYAERCVGCHGADARGTDQAPGLAGNDRLRRQSVRKLRDLVRNGMPGTGMPPFDLPARELDTLATFVHSLNGEAAASEAPGNQVDGERFFFGKGQCASCHMIFGRGEPIGPDLSNLGHTMTVNQIRSALLQPDAHITPGYEQVTVQQRDGKTLRGFVRSRSNFDIRLQDFQGKFYLLQEGQIAAIQNEKGSQMPPVKASPEELQNLMAYLSRLTGVKPGVSNIARPTGKDEIDFARIVNPKPGDWLTYNGRLSANRYSDLDQINTRNVKQLAVKWIFTVPLWKQLLPDTGYYIENMKYFGLEVTPLVADGVMYITGPHQALALDALTGRVIWEYSRPRTPGLVSDASLGTNRGVAILGDKVFMVTDNAHLIALNRTTGQVVWEEVMPDEPQHYGSTVAPLIVKDMVIAGVSGGDWGIRGFLAAYKVDTGERVWRFWTIPAKGEPGIETWKGEEPKFGGGPTWLTGSYDPGTDTLYWPTGNPYPDSNDRDRPGDNLFTNCILALNPDTGKLKWHYQFTPHDVHDWDATEPPVLIDTRYRGQDRKLMLFANRNGFFYVLDRTNGQVLLARPFINRLTWASGIGPDGRPQLLPESDIFCPEDATNWNATAFSPVTHLYYVMALEKCVVKLAPGSWKKEPPKEEPGMKILRALDIESGKVVWEKPQIGPVEGKRCAGVLATAGGLLFYGDPSGDFVALDERDGKTLWHFPTNGENKASPMTFMVGGKQFIALAIGPNIVCFGLP
jgi:PQQ-dependent dehydrogenase (methanol/ethanol family)